MRVAGEEQTMSKKIGPVAGVWQRNRHGRFAVLRSWVVVVFGSKCPKREAAACPSEIQRQIRMRGSLSPCPPLCPQLHVHSSG